MTPHASDRAKERYGLSLTVLDLRRIGKRIAGKNGMLMGKQNDGTEDWIIRIGKQLTRLIYDPRTGNIVTFISMFTRPAQKRYGRSKHA